MQGRSILLQYGDIFLENNQMDGIRYKILH